MYRFSETPGSLFRAMALYAVLPLAFPGVTPAAFGQGTPEGRYAARLVDAGQYRSFMEDRLYARNGHDRRYGPEHDLCRDAIQQLFTEYGLTVSMHAFTYNNTTYYNVVGEIPGATRSNEIYVVAGHFDSVGNPGADDNASAVAALLEIARLAGRWQSEATIRLISFDREEQYLIGSQAYVNDFGTQNFRGVVSLDMIAYSGPDPDKARIHGRTQSDPLKNAIAQALRDYAGLEPTVQGPLDRTDHAPFEWAGHQGCWLAEYNYIERNPHYHQPTDSVDTPGYIDFEYGANITRAVMGWLVDEAGLQPSGGGYTLSIEGSCPGTVEINWNGAGPGQQGLVLANRRGPSTIPGGQPCAGTILGIQGGVHLVDPPGIFGTNGGSGIMSRTAGVGACGKYLQLVKGGACITSNVVRIR